MEQSRSAGENWMERRSVRSFQRRDTVELDTKGTTELIHAVRGGLQSLNLALETLCGNQVRNEHGAVDLDKALGIKILADRCADQEECAKVWGRAMLLAAATKGGDMEVLRQVINAIKVCCNKPRHFRFSMITCCRVAFA